MYENENPMDKGTFYSRGMSFAKRFGACFLLLSFLFPAFSLASVQAGPAWPAGPAAGAETLSNLFSSGENEGFDRGEDFDRGRNGRLKLFYSVPRMNGAKGSGVENDQQLVNGGVYCSFAKSLAVKVWVEDAQGLCQWRLLPNDEAVVSINQTYGANSDTVEISFNELRPSESRQISIYVQDGDLPEEGIAIVIPQVAAPANLISVKTGLGQDEVYCEGLTYEASVLPDPAYTAQVNEYNRYGHDEENLRYSWAINLEEDGRGTNLAFRDFSNRIPGMYSFSATVPRSAENAFWVVQPATCDDGRITPPTSKPISHVIAKNLTPNTLRVKTIRYGEVLVDDGMGGQTMEMGWDTLVDGQMEVACVYYSDAFNNNPENYVESSKNHADEAGNGYVALQALPYDTEDEKFPFFAFEWRYDTNDLEMALDKMEEPLYKDHGFGPDKARVCFRVKNRENPVSAIIRVSYRMYCPSCQEMAKAQRKDTVYEKISEELELIRVDSVSGSRIKDHYHPYIATQEGVSIDGLVPKICGQTAYNLCNRLEEGFEGYTFGWEIPESWTSGMGGGPDGGLGGGTGGDMGGVPGGGLDEGGDCMGVFTPKVLGDAGHLGDTVYLFTYPKNACFQNGKDTARNGKALPVFLRTSPKKPVLIDTLEKEGERVFTGVSLEGDAMGGMPALPSDVPPVLLCNNSGIGTLGYSGQVFLLYNAQDAVLPAEYNPARPEQGGYGVILPEAFQEYISYSFLPYGNQTGANDTNVIRFQLDNRNHAALKGQTHLPIGIYAASDCGPGDTAFFSINIIDTLSVYSHVRNGGDAGDTGFDTVSFCEGVMVPWATETGNYISQWGNPDRNTDRVEYDWRFPASWHFLEESDRQGNPSRIVFGQEPGSVRLALRNRCGTGKERSADYVDVNAYTRVKIKVADGTRASSEPFDPYDPDTDPFLVEPCQGSFVMYVADTFDRTDRYQWTFPDDWEVMEDLGTAQKDPEAGNVAYTDNDRLNSVYSDMRVRVKVGADTGYVQVVGSKAACGFTFDNYESGYREDPPVGHRRDTLRVQVRPFTSRPEKAFLWPEAFCARKVYMLAVEPDPAQDSLTRANTYFTWKFPGSWDEDGISFANEQVRDTVVFTVPEETVDSDTLMVFSHRRDCETYNEGDTLVYVFRVIDTLSLSPTSIFVDLRNPGSRLDLTPCEGDTVFYALKGNNSHLDSIWFTWNSSNDFLHAQTDSIDASGWRVLNQPRGHYSDTLKMIAGRAPMRISAQAVSHCGLSAPLSTDSIRPVHRVRDTATWIQSRIILCEGEKAVFQHDSVENATAYAWFYPWGAQRDTATGYANVLREFEAGTVFDTGSVYVIPFNACGPGPESGKVEIASLIERLPAPDLSVPAAEGGAAHVFVPVGDTVFDTLCLRTEREYVLSFTHPDLEEGAWKYAWFALSLDPADRLEVQGQPSDSSRAVLSKQAGSGANYIGMAVRHQACLSYGDTLILRLQPADTAALPENRLIADYLTDLAGGGKIQLRPCGQDTVLWVFDKTALDPSITDFQFVWNGGDPSDTEFGREWNPSDSTMHNTSFKWFNPKPGEDPSLPEQAFYPSDSLFMRVGNGDLLQVAVNARNRCGISRFSPVTIKTSTRILDTASLTVKENTLFCDRERLVFETDADDAIGGYIWHCPWNAEPDTTSTPLLVVEGVELVPGPVYVIPYNGCGNGPASDTVWVEDIKRVPLRPEPGNFDYGYDFLQDPVARDSLCMRQPSTLKVDFPSIMGNPGDFEMMWRLKQGSVVGFNPDADSCVLVQEDVKGEPFVLEVFSRVKGCQRYSDTLEIRIFPMDTLAFLTEPVEDPGPFDLLLPEMVVDVADMETPIDVQPCGSSLQHYAIRAGMHWSLTDSIRPYFTWNKPGLAVDSFPREDGSLGGSDWTYAGQLLEEDRLYERLPLQAGLSDSLLLHVNVSNICGVSRSKGLVLIPKPLVTEKPAIQLNSAAICLGEEAEFQASQPRNAEFFIWDFPWPPYTDTTGYDWPILTVEAVGPETGFVRVAAANDCGAGPFDSLKVEQVMQTPKRPLPAWPSGSEYTWDADTVVEQICLHGETLLSVRRDTSDGPGLQFSWQLAEGGAVEMLEPTDGQPDTVCRLLPLKDAAAGDEAFLRVWGSYPQCGGAGDTLFIRLQLLDTVPVAALGALTFEAEEELDPANPEPCPGSQIVFAVENPDAAPSYRWTLPSDWKFADSAASRQGSVAVIVGYESGSVQVVPTTPEEVLGCQFPAPHPLESVVFRPRQAPVTEDFDDTFNERPCAGSIETYAVQATANAKAYRWEFPFDWKVQEEGAADTIWEAGLATCRVLVGKDSGFVRVYALDSCLDYAMQGSLTEREVWTVDTARIVVLGDNHVCRDSLFTLVVQASNAYADAGKYELEILYSEPDPVPVEINFPNPADSSLLEVRSSNTDTVKLVFTPKNIWCPQNVLPYTHYVLADTVPEIRGTISGPDTVCEDNFYEYVFHLDTAMYDIMEQISYRWEVPHEGWSVESQSDSTAVLHFRHLPAGAAGGSSSDTILCYPRGICGTALPVRFVVHARAADAFADSLIVESLAPCVGTELQVWLRDQASYDRPDSLRFVWNTPPGWQRLDADSLPATSYRVQLDTASHVQVRLWRKGACGLSQALDVRVVVRDSAAKAVLASSPYPCYTRETYPIVLAPAEDVDSVVWSFRPADLQFEAFTRPGASFKYDSVSVDNRSMRREPFFAVARTMNECGFRDTALQITPITGATPFEDTLHAVRVCVSDTGYAWISLPQEQKQEGMTYAWSVHDTSNRVLRAYVDGDSVAVLEYLSSPVFDTLQVAVVGSNDCASLPAVALQVVPFTFELSPASDPERGVYGQSGVRLMVEEVVPGEVSGYSYAWGPENRLLPADPGQDYRQTGVLVQEVETFYVEAVQKAEEGSGMLPVYKQDRLCSASDSVKIALDSLFAFEPVPADTLCIETLFQVRLVSKGGNQQLYHTRWWESYDGGDWVEMPGAADSLQLSLTFSEPGSYRYRVVGRDSTFLYEDGEAGVGADSLILATSHSDTVQVDLQVYDLEAELANVSSDPVQIPVGGRVDLEVRVEGGTGEYRYSWMPEDLVLAVDSLTGNMQSIALFRAEELVFSVMDSASGCQREITVRVRPGITEDIPNTFTPNGDGKNDIFLKGVSRLTIYSRWGEKLFHTDQGIGWDGTFKGKTVRPGEYLFVAEIDQEDGTVQTYKGVVTVKLR